MVAISDTRIANMALSHLGARHTIENLSEVSTEAEAAELWYEFSRLQTLESHDWGFARRRIVLTPPFRSDPDCFEHAACGRLGLQVRLS